MMSFFDTSYFRHAFAAAAIDAADILRPARCLPPRYADDCHYYFHFHDAAATYAPCRYVRLRYLLSAWCAAPLCHMPRR